MPEALTLDREHTAVLIMDYQPAILQNYSGDADALLTGANKVLDAVRSAGLPVIYIRVGFRPGYPEVSARNAGFSAVKQADRFAEGPNTDIHPDVAPKPGDVTVIKHRVGAFSGTDLEVILRAHDVTTLVLFGVSTSGVVLSTTRHAADYDYRIIIVKDLCADSDEEVHSVLTEKVFPRQATVVEANEVLVALAG